MKTTGLVFDSDISVNTVPAAGVLEDRSRFKNHGAITGATWTRLYGRLWYLDFDGSNYFEVPAAATELNFTSGEFTILVWVNPVSVAADQALMDKGLWNTRGYYFQIGTGGLIMFYTIQAAAEQHTVSTAVVTAGAWQLIGLTRSGAVVTTYHNGTDVTDVPGVHIDPVSAIGDIASFGVARTFGGGIRFFDGGMILHRIYNYALTVADISFIFQAEKRLFGM